VEVEEVVVADAACEAVAEADALHGSANNSIFADGNTDVDLEQLAREVAQARTMQWAVEHAPVHGDAAPG
jgi:hypothetical protein